VARPFQGRFVILRVGLAMFNPHIKFETSTITCNEEMKGTIKRNLSKSEGVDQFERKFLVDGDVARNSSMDR